MRILETKEIAGSKLVYDFQIKEKSINISSEKLITDKWLNPENWYWIYKKMTEVSLNYTSDKIKALKDFELNETLPGSIGIKIKLLPICKTIKKFLDLANYDFDHYFHITIECKDEILEREMNKSKPENHTTENHKIEYSPTPLNNAAEILVYTPKTRSSNKTAHSELSYTPSSKRSHVQNDHNEYVPKGVEKIVGISYTPTKISNDTKNETQSAPILVSSTSSDEQPTPSKEADNVESSKSHGRSHRNGKRVNYVEPTFDELPKRKKHKDKKDKFAELFDNESDTSDKDSSQGSSSVVTVSVKTPSKRTKSSTSTTATTSKSTKRSNRLLDQKVDEAIKKVTPNLDSNCSLSKLNAVLDTTFPIREINCFYMKKDEIKKSFVLVKPQLDKIIDDFYNNKILKLKKACDDPYLVHEIFSTDQLEYMYTYLQDHYLSDDESGATFCEFMTNHLLPTWALTLYSKSHDIPIEDVLNISN